MSNLRSITRTALAAAALLLLRTASPLAAAEQRNVRFERISLADGLSQALVTCTLQDRHGFIWFGTQEGLNRYDGYDFTVYTHNPDDPQSLPKDPVKSIVEDYRGFLWIGTLGGGLSRLDPQSGAFTHFRHDAEDPSSLSSDLVEVVFQDSERRLWVGTGDAGLDIFDPRSQTFSNVVLPAEGPLDVGALFEDLEGDIWIGSKQSGLYQYDPRSGQSRHYTHDPARPDSLSDSRVRAVLADRGGDLWIGTLKGGLNRLNSETGSIEHFRHSPEDPHSLPSDSVKTIFEDRHGTLWIGTDSGLAEWLPASRTFSTYVHDQANPFTLNHDTVISIAEDRGGVLWVGTLSGVNKWNRATEAFRHFRHSAKDPTQLVNSIVTSFAAAPDGATYVGTYGGGVSRLDTASGTFTPLDTDARDASSLSDDLIMSLYTDPSGSLWIGSRSGGLDRYDPVTGRIESFRPDPDDPESLSSVGVTSVLEDSRGRIWVGTYRGGLNRLDQQTGKFRHYRSDPEDPASLSSDRVVAIYEDRAGRLWIGTAGGGLNSFDPEAGTFRAYRHSSGDPRSLLSDDVLAIAEDEHGNMWLGTRGGGLNLWAAEQRAEDQPIFRHYTTKQGLLTNVVFTILFDDSGKIWTSSNRGLSRFDPERQSFVHYDESHGLQSNEFNFPAGYRAPSGELFFGGINGFNTFHPERLDNASYHAPIVLTEARISNEPATKVLSGTMVEAVEIGHKDRFFEFQFASLDFAAPKNTLYRYRLEGLDPRWIDLRSRRRIAYANLDPGTYTLRVGASNYDGTWNRNELLVALNVLPAPWANHWAKSLYALILGAALLLMLRAYRARLDRASELATATRAREIAEYASRAKSQFLANISHEIRTPLNGVLGMLELLLQTELSRNQQRFAATAGRSARHLLNLLNDLLDLSKIEAGHLSLERIELDLRQLVEEVIELFTENAQHKGLELFHQIPEGTPTAFLGDPTRLRQVLGNLIGNAIKFTDHGHVVVRCSARLPADSTGAELLFNIEDTGIGIDEETQTRVFESFRQADGSTTRKYGGTGLGLSISKQLVEMMGGEIWVESQPGAGSSFRFSLTLELQGGAERSAPTPALPGLGALIAHSNPVGAGILEDYLRDWGIATHRLGSLAGAAAELDALEARHFDLAIVDINLIESEGLDLTQALQHLPSETRVALLAPMDFKYEGEAILSGAEICLRKPLRRSDLLRFARGSQPADLCLVSPDAWFEPDELADQPDPPRVLVVEDNPTNQTVVRAMLESLDVRADIVDDGVAAVDVSARHEYDLILMDCQMPNMDGYDASRKIRTREARAEVDDDPASARRSVAIVAMTASAMAGDRERCTAAGMDDYLSKPFDREQLALILKRHLDTDWEISRQADYSTASPFDWKELEAEPEDDESALDPRPLEIIHALSADAGDELVATVIQSFLDDTPRMLAGLRSGLEDGEPSVLEQIAHRLKSSSANLGGTELSNLSRQLEALARDGRLDEASQLIKRIERSFARTRRALQERWHRAA